MPNWCVNKLTIYGSEKRRKEILEKIGTEFVPFDFNTIIPYPKKYNIMDLKYHEIVTLLKVIPQSEAEKYIKENNFPKDGFNSGGYDWCCNNWGTKWNACNVKVENKRTCSIIMFDTAWSPPIPVAYKMSQMFSDVKIVLKYWECGMGFQGKTILKGGEALHVEEKKYSGSLGG